MAWLNEKRLTRLRTAMDKSLRDMRVLREEREQAIKNYVGTRYMENGADQRMPVNLLWMAVSTLVNELVGQSPQCLVKPRRKRLAFEATLIESRLNDVIIDLKLQRVLADAVQQAMFGVGVVKVALDYAESVRFAGEDIRLTRTALNSVGFDNFVVDTLADRMSRAQFMGDRYRMDLDEVKRSQRFNRAARDKMVHTLERRHESGTERAAQISHSGRDFQDEFIESAELWDIYIPKERLLVTIPSDPSMPANLLLAEQKWKGPTNGCYYTLGFDDVPDNPLPLPPIALWSDLNSLVNSLYRKAENQARRQKTVGFARGSARDDADRIKKLKDGELLIVDDPAGVVEKRFGGPDQVTLAMGIHAKKLALEIMGNIEILAGLRAQSETLGQDQLLAANASKRVAGMQQRVTEFAADVIRHIGWYEYSEPYRRSMVKYRLSGTDYDEEIQFPPDKFEGGFEEHKFEIVPYSMRLLSPGQRLTLIRQALNDAAPWMPMIMQQGIQIDFKKYFDLYAKYSNANEIAEVFRTGQTSPVADNRMDEQRQAPVTHRTNERVSRAGASSRDADEVLMQKLLSGQQMGAQVA